MVRIVPGASELTRPYWEAAHEGRLVAQRCEGCGAWQHPPMPRCHACHGARLAWRELSGRGTVNTYTVVVHPTHFAFADKVPYIVGLVETEEGPQIISDLPIDPDRIEVGMPVHVEFERIGEAFGMPHFVPDDPSVRV